MPDPDLPSQSQMSHKLDVVVFVPVALNQFLNRPLFCVGKMEITFIGDRRACRLIFPLLIRILETHWMSRNADATARSELRKVHGSDPHGQTETGARGNLRPVPDGHIRGANA